MRTELKEIPINELTIEESVALQHEMWQEIAESEKSWCKEVANHNNRIFRAIESLRGKAYLKSLLACIEENEVNTDKFKIVRQPQGKYQKGRYGRIKGIWVKQYTGHLEDDFYGFISVEIKKGRWLEMPFSC